MMNQDELLSKIKACLENPIDKTEKPLPADRLQEVADLLMAFAPGRYRMLARRLVLLKSPSLLNAAWYSLERVHRQMSNYGSVAEMEQKLPQIVKQTEVEISKAEAVVPRGDRQPGKRKDHDDLPKSIQQLYDDNLELLQKQRSLFERMKVYRRQLRDQQTGKKAACDVEETCHMLQLTARNVVSINDKRLANWRKYDDYQFGTEPQRDSEVRESVTGLSDDEKRRRIKTHVSYLNRYIGRFEDESADAEKLLSLKESFRSRIDALRLLGYSLAATELGRKLKNVGFDID